MEGAMDDYYDRDGQPVTRARYRELLDTPGYARVALTRLRDGSYLSTVWGGVDHGVPGHRPPLFETQHLPSGEKWTYHSLQEARDMHFALVRELGGAAPSDSAPADG
jgi:hypothetical protein